MRQALHHQAAIWYHNEGLNVIPVVYPDKMPALPTWTEYQGRHSTAAEIDAWFGQQLYNIGVIHGQQRDGCWYALLDIDEDRGIFGELRDRFPALCAGRITQSGSGQGYHVHLFLDASPLNGRNGLTWTTPHGTVNLRAGSGNQTVQPPSVHPSGAPYRFLQKSKIVTATVTQIYALRAWLDEVDPPQRERPAPRRANGTRPANGPDLRAAVLDAWDTWRVLEAFGVAGQHERRRGETKVRERGGLFVKEDNATWYCFADECGGGPVEAWLWCRHGTVDRGRYREALVEMAQAAGLDAAAFYRPGDEAATANSDGDRQRWTRRYPGMWEKLR